MNGYFTNYVGVVFKVSFNYYEQMKYNCHTMAYLFSTPGFAQNKLSSIATSNSTIPAGVVYS